METSTNFSKPSVAPETISHLNQVKTTPVGKASRSKWTIFLLKCRLMGSESTS